MSEWCSRSHVERAHASQGHGAGACSCTQGGDPRGWQGHGTPSGVFYGVEMSVWQKWFSWADRNEVHGVRRLVLYLRLRQSPAAERWFML
jgi:hypothetical protein